MKKILLIMFLASTVSFSQNIDDVKKELIHLINNDAYPKGSFQFKHKFIASFEGDLLRLKIHERDKGELYDFSKSTQFHPVSFRNNDLAFINVYVSLLVNEKKDKWTKDKLVIRVNGHEKAELIQNTLEHYSKLLKRNL